MKVAKVSVPGKVHLIGEHVVVHGRPALISSIDKRCFVEVSGRNDKYIQIISKNIHKVIKINLNELAEKLENARDKWNRYIETKDAALLSGILKSPLDYPLFAAAETLKKYNIDGSQGFDLFIESQIPVGSGCGSSSAIAVGTAGALTEFLGKKIDKNVIFEIAVSTEQLRHGIPSGGDPACVLHGGLVLFQKFSETKRKIENIKINLDKKISSNFFLVDSGKPVESTGHMVSMVRSFRESNPSLADEIFDSQESLTHDFLECLKSDNFDSIPEIIRESEKNLERLGVVSCKSTEIIRGIEKAGGAAKISGAGGVREGSGMLLVYHKDKDSMIDIFKKLKLSFFSVELGEEGLKIEYE